MSDLLFLLLMGFVFFSPLFATLYFRGKTAWLISLSIGLCLFYHWYQNHLYRQDINNNYSAGHMFGDFLLNVLIVLFVAGIVIGILVKYIAHHKKLSK